MHLYLVSWIEDLVVLDQVDFQEQIFSVSNELITDFSSLLVGLELRILLTSV